MDTFYNDINDVGWKEKKKERYPIIIPRWMTDKEFATNIVNESIIYDQEIKDYSLFSANDWFDTEWNCHNFSTTMLMRSSNYSPSMLRDIQSFNPSGGNFWMWKYFEPVCIK